MLSTKWAAATFWSPRHAGGADGPIHAKPDALVQSVEKSLRQLHTDYLDILHFHGLRVEQYDEVMQRFAPVVARLKEQGKVRAVGLSERYIADAAHDAVTLGLQRDPQFWDVLMLKYGILNQVAADKALPLALKHNVGVMNMAAVRYKLSIAQKLRETVADWKARGLIARDSLSDEDPLDWLLSEKVSSIAAAAYKFAADHPAVSTVITGTMSLGHLEENAEALEDPTLPEAHKARLRKLFGHIAEYA